MIVTVTANPSFDRTIALGGRLERGGVLRADAVLEQAGGKGVNISRAAVTADIPSIAVVPAAKDDAFVLELLGAGIDCRPVRPAGDVRVNLTITEPDGTTTKLNSPGAAVLPLHLELMAQAVLVRGGSADALTRAVAHVPGARVLDRAAYVDHAAGAATRGLTLMYGFLGMSLLLALFGMATTVSMSVFERTREFGLLGAVGATAAQIRSIVRWEAATVVVLGTLLGVGVAEEGRRLRATSAARAARSSRVSAKSAAYRKKVPSWSGSRHSFVCTVLAPSPLSGLPSASTGFHRLASTNPGLRTPMAQLMLFTVISLMPPPPDAYPRCVSSQ